MTRRREVTSEQSGEEALVLVVDVDEVVDEDEVDVVVKGEEVNWQHNSYRNNNKK
eukprot:m.240528 g.240528  ORF g.240528 m.240528 type:complete len:55 (-) comp15357_c0_seq1:65-229(-)